MPKFKGGDQQAALLPRLLGNNVPGRITRAPSVWFEQGTNNIQFYSIKGFYKSEVPLKRVLVLLFCLFMQSYCMPWGCAILYLVKLQDSAQINNLVRSFQAVRSRFKTGNRTNRGKNLLNPLPDLLGHQPFLTVNLTDETYVCCWLQSSLLRDAQFFTSPL